MSELTAKLLFFYSLIMKRRNVSDTQHEWRALLVWSILSTCDDVSGQRSRAQLPRGWSTVCNKCMGQRATELFFMF